MATTSVQPCGQKDCQSEQIACVHAFLSGEQEATSVKLRIEDQLQVFQERRSC